MHRKAGGNAFIFLTKVDSGPPRFGPPFKTVGLEREIASSSVRPMRRLQGYKYCLAETLEFFVLISISTKNDIKIVHCNYPGKLISIASSL